MTGLADRVQAGERQPGVKKVLQKLAQNPPPRVILLEGGTSGERFELALYWGAALSCRPPEPPCLHCPTCTQIVAGVFQDIVLLDGREEKIKIDMVRELRELMGQAPKGKGHRLIILSEAQQLTTEAANSLLKSLEEPAPGNVFALLVPQREGLLPTLVSRSWVLTLGWHKPEGDAALNLWLTALDGFLQTGRGWFNLTSAKSSVDAGLVQSLIVHLQGALVQTLSQGKGPAVRPWLEGMGAVKSMQTAHLLDRTREALVLGVNPALVLDWMALGIRAILKHPLP
ncbi:MAG: DNA polymerase III subunit delta [Desulfovibrionales bacterium]